MKSISSLLADRLPAQKKKVTERGELLKYFAEKLNTNIPFVATKLKGMHDLQTLYFIKSDCDQAAARGVPWSAAFNKSLQS